MDYANKIKIAVRDDLEPWQELNVAAFLASAIAGTQDVMGAPYEDASGQTYLPMCGLPMLIHVATADELARVREGACRRDMACAVYTHELFSTMCDEDNRAEVARHESGELDLVGVAVYGRKNPVDRLFNGIRLHG